MLKAKPNLSSVIDYYLEKFMKRAHLFSKNAMTDFKLNFLFLKYFYYITPVRLTGRNSVTYGNPTPASRLKSEQPLLFHKPKLHVT